MNFTELLIFLTIPARMVLGTVFLWSGVTKLRHRRDFAHVIFQHRLLSQSNSRRTAIVLPIVEILLGVSLSVGWELRNMALLSILLLSGFIGVALFALLHRRSISCMCFGNKGERIGTRTIWRNSLLAMGGLVLLTADSAPLSVDEFLRSPYNPLFSGSASSIAGAIFGIVAIVVFARLVIGAWRMTLHQR